jgi:hypothetical protein
MGRRRKNENNTPPKNNLTQDLLGNEENGCPDPDLNKTMINVTKQPIATHIKTLKKEILEYIMKKFMEKIQDMVNQKYKMRSRNFKTLKIDNTRRHRNK